jgi:hypothetical protein
MAYPQPPMYAPAYPTKPPTNGMAIGAMVTSLVSTPLCFACGIGILGCIVGIVLGVVALNQLKQHPQNGRGFAITGIVVGAVAPVLYIVVVLALVVTNHSAF